jgi:DNA-3-methyladenine glycosylase II
MSANRVPSVTIPTPQPFDFNLTVGHQTYYRGKAGADLFAEGTYYRALRHVDRVVVAAAAPYGDDKLAIRLPLGGSPDDLGFAAEMMARLLGLDIDLTGFYRLLASDEVLFGAVGTLRGLRPTRSESVFEALVMAIVAQQISSAIARIIRDGLVGAFGEPVTVDGYELQAFPAAETLLRAGTDALRAHKLSARKVEYIQDMAQRTMAGTLEAERFAGMDDEEATAELMSMRGIGRWTAEGVLIRALGRTDLLPAGDVALRKVVADLYFDGGPITERQLAVFALERWSPYRSLVTTYLFAHLRKQRVARARP